MNTRFNALLKLTVSAAIGALAVIAVPAYADTSAGAGTGTDVEKCVEREVSAQYRHPAERKMAVEAQRQCEEVEFAAFEVENPAVGKPGRDCKREIGFVHPAIRLARARAGC